MRALGFFFTLFLVVGVASAQAPSNKPSGTLAQLMRGILFPNSNLIFDVQAKDPEAPPEAGGDGTVTSTFASIYAGWPSVENAALALAESANLIVLQGRMCENGRPSSPRPGRFRPVGTESRRSWAGSLPSCSDKRP